MEQENAYFYLEKNHHLHANTHELIIGGLSGSYSKKECGSDQINIKSDKDFFKDL